MKAGVRKAIGPTGENGMAGWQAFLDENRSRFQEELFDFLRIPSVSALPEHKGDVAAAAGWVEARLKSAGLTTVDVVPTAGHPAVLGEWMGAPGKPTILIYGHYDTQPVDPVEEWTTPPFEPTLRGGRIYARGSSDDKGNMLIPILAIEALLKSEGALPVNVKVLFEGEEEVGSGSLPSLLETHKERLACDLVVNADGTSWSEDRHGILVGLRGACAIQIDMKGPQMDLHSGIYGGAVQNPLHAMTRLLDSMHAPDGTITVDGFFDDVVPVSDADRDGMSGIPFDADAYKQMLGVADLFGEPGYTPLEQVWVRPTVEVNGVWGGFTGSGVKTVIPKEAHAKLTSRLVPNQEPQKIVDVLIDHIRRHTPLGVTVDVKTEHTGAKPYLIPTDHPGNVVAARVMEQVYGTPPFFTRLGGSIPICALLLDMLEVYTVTLAFGLEDENAHAPDEFFRIESFERGQKAWCMMMEALAVADLT